MSPVELLFVFSSLSNWREGGKDTHRCHLSGPVTKRPSRGASPAYRPSIAVSGMSDHRRPSSPSSTPDTLLPPVEQAEENTSIVEREGGGSATRGDGTTKVLSGSLVMETYSWRTARFGSPVLQVSTTGVKGAVFSLPAG